MLKKFLIIALGLLISTFALAQSTEHVRASLSFPARVRPNSTVLAKIKLEHDKGWHTYGPAEVGATTIEWRLPRGWHAGEIRWPNEENFVLQGISSWGYGNTVVLTVPLRASANVRPEDLAAVEARLDWIVCGDGLCIPGAAVLKATSQASAPVVAANVIPEAVKKVTMQLDWKIILGAFAGGLILNLMPCVFPVLGIKILSFAKNAGQHRGAVVSQALAYGLGIIISACVLGAVIVTLRTGSAAIGWGFQLQDFRVVWVMTAVLMLFAMNMAGGWELPSLGGHSYQQVAKLGGWLGAFGSGALMVAIATPCSAPFLAVAIGGIFVLPAWQAILVMAVMGLGMALPYWMLAAWPEALKSLPKPGVWMDDLKKILAWVMAAAALYQAWVYVGQVPADDSLRGLMGLLAVLAGVWAVVHWKRIGRIVGLFLIFMGAWSGLATVHQEFTWEAWSPQRVGELRREGRAVVVDFTARWCVNCLINERVVWQDEKIKSMIRKNNIALLKADWTRRDEVIANELKRRGRSAVPLLVIYKDGAPADGVELPNLLSAEQVAQALE